MFLNIYQEVYKRKIDENSENIIFARELTKILDDNMQSVFLEPILNQYRRVSIEKRGLSAQYSTLYVQIFANFYVFAPPIKFS